MANYDYGMMFQGMTLKPGIADQTTDEVAKAMTMASGKLVKRISQGVNTLDGGGWEVVSHALLRIDRHLLVSSMIRRESKKK